jgi:hypothetical protein
VADIGLSEGEKQEIRKYNILDFLTATILALTTMASAWGAYQATRWGGVQYVSFSESAVLRAEAARRTNVEIQLVDIDVGLFTQYSAALTSGNKPLADFLFQRFTPDLKAATEAWLETNPLKNPNAPPSPFVMKEYPLKGAKETQAFIEKAEAKFEKAKAAKQIGDNYIFLALLFEMVLFFSSVGTKFGPFNVKALMLSVSTAILVAGLIILFSFPMY